MRWLLSQRGPGSTAPTTNIGKEDGLAPKLASDESELQTESLQAQPLTAPVARDRAGHEVSGKAGAG